MSQINNQSENYEILNDNVLMYILCDINKAFYMMLEFHIVIKYKIFPYSFLNNLFV